MNLLQRYPTMHNLIREEAGKLSSEKGFPVSMDNADLVDVVEKAVDNAYEAHSEGEEVMALEPKGVAV